jgi:aldose 1-epimerase
MTRRLLTAAVYAAFAGVVLASQPLAGEASPQRTTPGRYVVSRISSDIVQLRDTRDDVVVSVLTPVSNAYDIQVKGQPILRRTYASLDALRASPGLNGVPLLWPYANRLDEQAFYANGTKYSFDTGLGNTGRGAIPIHGFLTNTKEWRVVDLRADADGAWVTSRLEFYRYPRFMKQFPFAHVLTMTYRLADGALEVRTAIENLSTESMPVTVGFHPYFQLTDSERDDWTLAIRGRTHWLLDARTIPTGETQPVTALVPDPHRVPVRDFPNLDDVFTDLERDAQGRAAFTLKGRQQEIDVVVGPKFTTMLVLTRTGGARRGGPASPTPGSVALEPMAAVSNAMNLAEQGRYKDLQYVPPGGTWEESFWIRARGF